ncbi:hypothetical protein ARMGADRAFT_1037175 [Armillaria gallica]|uniref:Uncharacterized protein n=1 Tax=Armillaria gallica TaxID=47427 RepID=A0A2H3DAE2_ARMGA|nr:hypothetical protein ARMGADRAFT_1037175 [Armillaria gallica]
MPICSQWICQQTCLLLAVHEYSQQVARLSVRCKSHLSSQVTATTPALNASLKVARIAEASGVPYVEKLAKVAVAIFELLEKKGKNKEATKDLCKSISNTVVIINTLVGMQGGKGETYFKDICVEMEGYLSDIAQGLSHTQRKYCGLKAIFNVDEFRDAIQAYEKRVDDLKMDFLIQVTGDCMLALIELSRMQHELMAKMENTKEATLRDDTVIRIIVGQAALFFLHAPATARIKYYTNAESADDITGGLVITRFHLKQVALSHSHSSEVHKA